MSEGGPADELLIIVALAGTRPSVVPMLMDIGALVAERLRHANAHAAAQAERMLAEEHTRLVIGLVHGVDAMQGWPVLRMFSAPPPGAPARGFNPWLALAYVVFAPFQELIYRVGVQGRLSHFLIGRWRDPLAILGANIVFSAAHLYVSTGLAVMAFVAGLFWGCMYARQRGLAGVSVSHVLLGFWAFEVVDLGVLE